MLENELIIREHKIPLLNRIIFSVAFSSFIVLLIYLYNLDFRDSLTSGDKITIVVYTILLFLILLFSFMPLIKRHYIHLKFEEQKIRHSYEIGRWKFDEKWQDLTELKYISVFRVNDAFQVNLWYENNDILYLFVTENYELAIDYGHGIATKLNIDLLDASVRGHHRWINQKVYAETSKITYLE